MASFFFHFVLNRSKVYNLYMRNVPKKIHLLWFGNKEPNIPYLAKIREIYADYQIKLWTEEDFDMENLNEFTKFAYEQKKWSFVSDYFRMKILSEEGGIYLDTDMEPVKKFNLDSDAKLFMGYEYRNNATMGFIACAKGHRFPEAVMEYYESIRVPAFFPLGNLVWTEILYSLYPTLGVANESKKHKDLHMMNRNAFGLWKPNKHDSYFIHRHSIDWIDSKFQRGMIHFAARFAKLTPAFAENIMVMHQRRMTAKKPKDLMHFQRTNQLVTIIEDEGYLTKEILDKILSFNQGVKVHLHYKNERLKKTLMKIYNVKEVTYGPQKTKHTYEDIPVSVIGNTNLEAHDKDLIIFEFKPAKGRANIETTTNIYSRLFNHGYEKVLIK